MSISTGEKMERSKLSPCFMRLIQSLKMNKTKNHGITVFIGAGCSLTSTNKNITTYNIVRSLVQQFSIDSCIPDNWKELYEIFVNTVWNGQGAEDRIQLLEDFFQDMEPSIGYQNLRWLLENGYINNIITTNFDLMIDQILDGLSYHLIVGDSEENIGDSPAQFTLIKAHGDLQHGQLRFSPSELSKLPNELSDKIRKLTQNTVIVIGYRGQDVGILNALYDINKYNAFWISLEEPDRLNRFENDRIYTWMYQRNSEDNFLYGEEFGHFDNIMEKIKCTLIHLDEQKKNNKQNIVQELWGKSVLYNYFCLNRRFLKLFKKMYQYLDEYVANSPWKAARPFYAPSLKNLISSTLNLLNENIIPYPYNCIENEVDALVFSVSCSIWLISQGYPYTSMELVRILKERFEKDESEISINPEFWITIDLLSNPEKWRESSHQQTAPVSFCFNQERELSVVLKDVNLYNTHRLIEIIDCILLFVHTSGNDSFCSFGHQKKQMLEKYLYEIQSCNGKILLRMSTIPMDCYHDLYVSLLKEYFTEHCIGDRCTLYHEPIYVDFAIEPSKFNANINVWEMLIQDASNHCKSFMKDFIPQLFIESSFSSIFQDFLNSGNNGLFIIGESGCGKTILLKQWIQKLETQKYMIYPIIGREQIGSNELGEGGFGNLFFDKNKLGYLQIMLKQRQQILLLIFDALNEIQGNFSYIVSNYKSLLNFCDRLTNLQIKNVKLIITCRSDSYQQLKRSSNIIPSTRSFFSVMANNEISTVYTIPFFKEEDVESFVKLYHSKENTLTFSLLKKEFGNLIYLPINLRIICDTYQKIGASDGTTNKEDIFKKWFDNLQVIGKSDGLSIEAIENVIEYTIYYKYFGRNNENLKTHIIAAELKSKYPNVLMIYEWLANHGIYEKNVSAPNSIQFAHDNIEEYFLSQYISTYYSGQLQRIDTALSDEILDLAVVKSALQNTFYHKYKTDQLAFINLFVCVVQEKSKLLSVCIHTYFKIAYLDFTQGYHLLQTLNQYLLQKDFHALIESILFVIKQKLDSLDNVILSGIQIVNQIIESTNCRYDRDLYALGLFLEAKAQYSLVSANNTDKYVKAYELCQKAERQLTQYSPYHLTDDIKTLQGIILQVQGHLNEAIKIMQDCYKHQMKNGLYNDACQSALNLGATYRNMTQFDKAIELYNSIDIRLVTDETKIYRLSMNIGIIYKNRIQNALFTGDGDTKENIELYKMAFEHFEKTCAFAEKNDDVPLKLEIYAELVECTCIGYYLNIATIEDAISWVNKMGDVICRYPIPVERIQYLRMQARVLTLKHELSKAIVCLEEGYSIAISYGLPYWATDCCNLITGIISDNLDNERIINDEILQKGLFYGEYAINYYKQLNNDKHRYLQDSIIKYERIKNYMSV